MPFVAVLLIFALAFVGVWWIARNIPWPHGLEWLRTALPALALLLMLLFLLRDAGII